MGEVALQGFLLNGASERLSEKRLQASGEHFLNLFLFKWCFEKFIPYADRFRTEGGTAHDGPAKLKKGLHQKGRKRKVISLVVVPMLGPQILRERPHSGKPRFNQAGLTQRPTAHGQGVRHPASDRLGEITRTVPHHFLGQRKNRYLELEQVLNGVGILKTVHPADPGGGKGRIFSN